MMVVPFMAAAGAAAAAAPGAQAADDLSSLDDTCLECAGIGIVPCKYAGVLMLWFCIMAGLQALCIRCALSGQHAPTMRAPCMGLEWLACAPCR